MKKRFDRLQKKDPKKKLEEIYKDQSNVLKLIDQYRIDLKSSEEAIAQAKNTIVYQTLGLKKIKMILKCYPLLINHYLCVRL